jgi:hypothetical protein
MLLSLGIPGADFLESTVLAFPCTLDDSALLYSVATKEVRFVCYWAGLTA